MLQLDSDDDFSQIDHGLPAHIRLLAGGPVFKFDPQMGLLCHASYEAQLLCITY